MTESLLWENMTEEQKYANWSLACEQFAASTGGHEFYQYPTYCSIMDFMSEHPVIKQIRESY